MNQRFRKNFARDKTHILRKQPLVTDKKKNEVFITNKSNFLVQLNQCIKLIESGESEIVLHGLGAAIRRTVNMALQLEEKYCGYLELNVRTTNVMLIDYLEPVNDDGEFESCNRINSGIDIHLVNTFKKKNITT